MLDTGATNVSIPAHIARDMYLPDLGQGIAQTANGSVQIMLTSLESVTLGDLKWHDVRASVNPGMKQDEILLGMSVLKE